MSTAPYYIARNPSVSPANLALAKTRAYSELSEAWSDMGDGVIFDSTGYIAVFHESHLRWVEHYNGRMANA